MNLLDTLARAEAVVDLLRVNLAGDFCADLASNRGPTLIEAKQDSGVAACELVEYLIRSARQEITARFAEEVANAYAADQANAPTAEYSVLLSSSNMFRSRLTAWPALPPITASMTSKAS